MTVDTDALRYAYERIGEVRSKTVPMAEAVLRKHGAIIERNAAPLTPVDMGFLRRATASDVTTDATGTTLTVANRMIYARYQHDTEGLHHTVGGPFFIRDPFREEIPRIKAEITARIMEAAQK